MRITKSSRWLKTRHCEISVPKLARRTPNRPQIWKQMIFIFGENNMISNSKVKKRSRNFYGANGNALGIFQTESVLNVGIWDWVVSMDWHSTGTLKKLLYFLFSCRPKYLGRQKNKKYQGFFIFPRVPGSENRDRGGIRWYSEPTSPPGSLLKIINTNHVGFPGLSNALKISSGQRGEPFKNRNGSTRNDATSPK